MFDLLASSLSSTFNVPHLIARIAISRGVKTVSEFHALLYGNSNSLLDPFSMLGMNEAVEWILNVREKKETLFVFGDYAEYDLEIVLNQYDYDEIEIVECMVAQKAPLPEEFQQST